MRVPPDPRAAVRSVLLELDPEAAPRPLLLLPEDLPNPGVVAWVRGLALSPSRQGPLALLDPSPWPGTLSENREVPGFWIAPLGGRET